MNQPKSVEVSAGPRNRHHAGNAKTGKFQVRHNILNANDSHMLLNYLCQKFEIADLN